jgi:hypothetical protein
MHFIYLIIYLLKINVLWAELIYKKYMKMHAEVWFEDLLENSTWRTEKLIEHSNTVKCSMVSHEDGKWIKLAQDSVQ